MEREHSSNRIYTFMPDHATNEAIPFQLKESENLPDMNFSKHSWIGKQEYQKGHAISISSALQLVVEQSFGGIIEHVYYSGEYGRNLEKYSKVFQELVQRITNLPTNTDPNATLTIFEIGGQEGGLMNNLLINIDEKNIARNRKIHSTILDLDISRRRDGLVERENSEYRSINYIEDDAHRLEEIALENDIPKQDCIIMVNSANVCYNPVSILKQSWNLLEYGGSLFIGNSVHEPVFPVWVEGDDAASFYYGTEEDYKKEKICLPEWRRGQNKFLTAIPDEPFVYNSWEDTEFTDTALSAKTTAIAKAYKERLPNRYPRFYFDKILQKLGYSVETLPYSEEGDLSERYVFYEIKKNQEKNPFSLFEPFALKKIKNEILLLQVCCEIIM